MVAFIDLTGQTFGRLTVIKRMDNSRNKKIIWLCKCRCGGEKIIDGANLRNGDTQSCGCIKKERLVSQNTKHNQTFSPTHTTWRGMLERCRYKNNKRYDRYGGRGISVCKEWYDFNNFIRDMGERPEGKTLDRIDLNGNYCKENCRWATLIEQANNRTNNHNLTYKGMTKTLKQLADIIGMDRHTIKNKLNQGWVIDEIINHYNKDVM